MTAVEATLARLRRALDGAARRARDLEGALQAAEMLGALDWRANDGRLAEEALEADLAARHAPALEAAATGAPPPTVDWLHLISKPLEHGGHTLLLLNLLEELARRGARQAVVSTRRSNEYFAARVAAAGGTLHLLEGSLGAKAGAVLRLGRGAARIVLHIHPDDIGAALAARKLRAEGRRVLFVNHADHAFSYGPGAASATMEISGIGWRLTAARRATPSQGFLGIPVPIPPDPPVPRPDGPILSMGAGRKYGPGGGVSFPAFLLDLLPRTDRAVELIGPTGEEHWWAEIKARHPGRVHFLGPLPFPQATARLAKAGAYVDSFPINGGTAFPQALMAGRTVFGPGGAEGGYGLAESLRSPSVAAMTEELLRFLADRIEPPRQSEIRKRIRAEFSAAAVTDRLVAAAEGRLAPVPPELAAPPRDLDYHVRIWREQGWLRFDLGKADRIGAATRLELGLQIIGRSHVRRYPPLGRKRLARWLATGRM